MGDVVTGSGTDADTGSVTSGAEAVAGTIIIGAGTGAGSMGTGAGATVGAARGRLMPVSRRAVVAQRADPILESSLVPQTLNGQYTYARLRDV